MQNLEHFKNIHQNQDIYVIASGKSCDFIDPDFFNNKITIGINQVYKKFDCKYYVRKEHELVQEVLNNINSNSFLFVSKYNAGYIPGKEIINESKYINNKKLIVYNHYNNICKYTGIPKNDSLLLVSHSTITTGIHLAAHMGAKNIILVGHDGGSIDDQINFNNYHSKDTMEIAWGKINPEKKYLNWVKNVDHHTILLKKDLKHFFNINVYSLNPFINFNLEGHIYKK